MNIKYKLLLFYALDDRRMILYCQIIDIYFKMHNNEILFYIFGVFFHVHL